MKVKKKQWGGARKGSGPKPKEEGDLKKPVTVYVTQNQIDKVGGIDAARKKCYAVFQ